ncbi:MAG: molybdopterin-dependent oxidoreductase [Gemmatimonadetes bacterium]|nr:molybdopterin-dependent oxidoreductase [Gemmatimonadota bacterium]
MGSNMAECHPVAFRWPMRAKVNGAKIVHVDPRFTRTSAVADLHVPIRAGTDIAFLGGLINHVLNSPRWNSDPFFREYVLNYTNAATLINAEFRDTEDLAGRFSGLEPFEATPFWAYDAFVGTYRNDTWQYDRGGGAPGATMGTQGQMAAGRPANTEQSGEAPGGRPPGTPGGAGQPRGAAARPPGAQRPAAPGVPTSPGIPGGLGAGFDPLVRSLLQPAARTDPTLQDPRCVFQIVKRHFSRYTPEMVELVCGSPKEKFLKLADWLLENSGRERTSAFAYAVAWTQHTYGVQMISCCALLQLLLGNMGRPGGGIMALRGHAAIQGSTDVPTLYHSIHGYMSHPSALKKHDTLYDYLTTETTPTGYWANLPKFMVSYLKSFYGDNATPENDFGYDWHPKIVGDHSHMAMFAAMADGKVKGMFCIGQNPATSLNAKLERAGLRRLEWLVVKDNWLTETATHWYTAPEVKDGTVKVEDIQTEVFFFPSTQIGEYDGSFTNTQRMLQWHFMAARAPGDCRTDTWFYYNLGKRLKKLYADSTLPRDQGWKATLWDYDPEPGTEPLYPGEPDARKLLRELNGYQTGDPSRHLPGFAALKDDGSTTCASWIYCGCYPAPDRNLTASRVPDPPGRPGAQLGWGFAWPANRRVMYNRASADPAGNPWSERKRWVWWDGAKWTGYDVPDFGATTPPTKPANPGAIGLDALAGTDPFIMMADGKGHLFVPTGLVDGPLPTHYEPAESPVRNAIYPAQQTSPVLKYWKRADNPLAGIGDPRYPHVVTTYRLTEHYLSGSMSRWLPWLSELQPEFFIEIGTALAEEKGIRNLDRVRISSPRGVIHAKALVTNRIGVLDVGGRKVHHVGMPWHWGWMGLSTGDPGNTLTSFVGDPNVSIHEGKAFVCNVEKA